MPEHNRFLEGPLAPIEEEITAFGLPVTGSLPAELNGRYLRNGPNPLGLDDRKRPGGNTSPTTSTTAAELARHAAAGVLGCGQRGSTDQVS
jgi:hypothetical protein